MDPEKSAPWFFMLLMAAAAYLLFEVIRPIASALFLAGVLATVLWPLQDWITKRLPTKRRGIAAGLVTVAVVLAGLGPISALVAIVIRDGADGIAFVSETLRSEQVVSLIERLPETAQGMLTDGIAHLPKSFSEIVGSVSVGQEQALAAVDAAKVAGSLLFHSVLMVIALFFFLVRGDEIVKWLDSISPLGRGQTSELLLSFKNVSYAVIVSTIVTSAVQATAALIGYYIAQVPSPIFFGAVTFFAAFIPAIGAGVICLVAALLLFITGHTYPAIFLALWGLLIVGLVDNLIKPLLIKRGMEIHGAVVFFALIGGLAAFGAIGLLIGPLVVAMFMALVRMYHRDFSPSKKDVPSVPGIAGTKPAARESK